MDSAILKFDTPAEAAEACGARTLELLGSACAVRGRALLAVSGGSTPRMMFEWMARQSFDWAGVHIFWVDERCVPPDDGQSNFRMTRESLLDHIRIPARQVHRISGELPPAEAAAMYSDELHGVMGERPVFDVIQRGMGEDGHTASLFPGEPLIGDAVHTAGVVWAPARNQHRVTLLPSVLEGARSTLCLATGGEKAAALRRVFREPANFLQIPAQIASPETVWYVDARAAAEL